MVSHIPRFLWRSDARTEKEDLGHGTHQSTPTKRARGSHRCQATTATASHRSRAAGAAAYSLSADPPNPKKNPKTLENANLPPNENTKPKDSNRRKESHK